MATRKARSRRASPSPRRRRPIERRSSPPRIDLGTPIDWSDVAPTVRAMAQACAPTTDFRAFARLVVGLTEPLRQLESLSALAERGLAGDPHATEEFRARLDALAARTGRVEDTLARFEQSADCDCGVPPSASVRRAASDARGIVDEGAAASLLLATARLQGGCNPDARSDALGAVLGLVLAAGAAGGLVVAARRGGVGGVRDQLARLSADGRFGWLPQPMHTLSGPMPRGLDLPPLPAPGGLPGLPSAPGLPPGLGRPPIGGDDDLPWPKHFVDELLGWLRKRRQWDPEIWDHAYPWWREPQDYIDWRQIAFIRCVIRMFRLLKQRAAIAPPPRPRRVTWVDGIASIASGACAGDALTIHGTGLLATGAVLLLPFADGCRPVDVAPGDWTDTTITVTLPPGVISGPVGFGDAAYIAAYDAWAAEQNRLAGEIETLPCSRKDIPWVPPFGECPPDLGTNRLTAGAAIIDAFTINGVDTLVLEAGNGANLAWSVRNATTVRIERTSASGPTFGGSTTLLNPIGNYYPLGAFSFVTPTRVSYRITAVGPCGTVFRDVTVLVSKRPGLVIAAIEVTQSIQTTTGSVRLVTNKPTVVRVTVRHGLNGFGGNTVPNVRGRIRVRRPGTGTSAWIDAANGSNPMAPNPGASIVVPANPSRNNTNDTLNFLIPPAWCGDTVRYEIEVRVTGYGAMPGFAGFDQSLTLNTGPFTFQPRRTLELRYVRVRWNGTTPTDQTCRDTLRFAVPLLPTPTANISALGGVGVQTPGSSTDDARDDLLDDFDDRHNCSWWEAMWEWLGADCPDDDGAIWVLIPGVFHRGRAYDIPSNVCFTPPSTATTTFGPYAAHELSHCFDQEHVSVMCANGQTATGGDAPGDWPNNAQLVDVPFDSIRNKALTLSGTGVFDVMTYCGQPDNTWPMPARWDRLWNEIGS